MKPTQILAALIFLTGITQPVTAQTPLPPVKVYILMGQTNMVGIGQIGPVDAGQIPTYQTAEQNAPIGSILSIYPGPHRDNRDYDKEKPLQTHVVKLGHKTPDAFPALEEGQIAVARGFVRIPVKLDYSFHIGPNSILEVDGKILIKNTGEEQTKFIAAIDEGTYPIRLTYLKPEDLFLGFAIWNVPGTLSEEVQQGKFPYLVDQQGKWIQRKDVWYHGLIAATANKWLAPGCGRSPEMIGPELGFGHTVGNYHDEPVLIIKASQGNRSLGWDFLPPGSERLEVEGHYYAGYRDPQPFWPIDEKPEIFDWPVAWYAGKQYDDCVIQTKTALREFDLRFPQWAGRGYEITGFGWFQGHKDTGNVVHAARYETNLTQLIKSLRKDFNAPEAMFVVATGCGNEGRQGTDLYIAEAQLAVDGSTGKYPEFKGNVKSVDTRNFFPKLEESPQKESHHYHQNAGTYIQIGESMGKAMVELIKEKKK